MLVVCMMFFYKSEGFSSVIISESYSDGWYYDDGSKVDFSDLRNGLETHEISRVITPEEVKGADLCFETSNLFFDVFIDDDLIYDYHPDIMRICGTCYGESFHTVDIPRFSGQSELRIVYQPLRDSSSVTFRLMQLNDGGSYLRNLYSVNFPKFMECFAVFIIGLTLVVIGFILNKDTDRIIETVSVGTMAIVLAMWTSSGTKVFQLIGGNPAFIRLVDYLSLMWLPVPVILFAAAVTDKVRSISTKIVLVLVSLNTVITFTCVLCGMGDYHDMLILTHIVIGIGVVCLINLLVSSIKKSQKISRGLKVLLVAFGLLILSGIGDATRYYLITAEDSSRVTRIGLFIFVIVLASYELSSFIGLHKKSTEAEVMHRLAHIDGLTGMLNRLAFTEDEREIKNAKEGRYLFAQFDINFLKKMNDTYGHSFGDRFIIAAADAITGSFGKCGKVYRVGGDEFIVIVEGDSCEKDFDDQIPEFERLVKQANEKQQFPIPLVIAYGRSVYTAGAGSLDDTEKTADKLMYDNKMALKASV